MLKNQYADLENEEVETFFIFTQKLFSMLELPVPRNLEIEVAETIWEWKFDRNVNSGFDRREDYALMTMAQGRWIRGGIILTEEEIKEKEMGKKKSDVREIINAMKNINHSLSEETAQIIKNTIEDLQKLYTEQD